MSDRPHPTLERRCDVAVIGGSAAGLAAALQLARQRRSVIVVDDGTPRNASAPQIHGYLGRDGAPLTELTATGHDEVRTYGGEILTGRALATRRDEDGRFRVELTGGHALLARRLLAATGLADELPNIDGLAAHWGSDVIHCPFCHGYEVRDRRLIQIVTHPTGLHPASLLRHLTERLTVVVHDADGVDVSALDALGSAGVSVERMAVQRVVAGVDGRVAGVELADGRTLDADAIMVGPRFRARVEVFATAGLTTVTHPSGFGNVVEIDERGGTAVPGLFAAGSLTDPAMQVLHAAAHGSRVGAMIAFDLADDDLRDAARTSGERSDWEHRYSGDEPTWSGNPNGTLVHEVANLPPARVLDVGAGEGGDAIWLAEHGWQVTANDISPSALARISAEAGRQGLELDLLAADANDLDAFGHDPFDLVSMQYGAILRTPEQRGLRNLTAAVAPGGTLLVVGHDLTALDEPVDTATQTRMFDPDAYLGVDEIAAALATDLEWSIQVHETRPRPPGAASTQHVHDVVLRARRGATATD